MQDNFVQARLDIFAEQYGKQIDQLAEDIRKHFVIPYCDKTGRRFSAGMGTWCFIDEHGNFYSDRQSKFYFCDDGDVEQWSASLPPDLCDILEAKTIFRTGDLGAHMQDYTPANYGR